MPIVPLHSINPDLRSLLVVLYVGPDLILPLTSAFAAVVGVLLMFWQRLTGMVGSVWNLLFQRTKNSRG